jgi:hypothetical protein
MMDLFAKIPTRNNQVRQMPASTVCAFIKETKKKLPRHVGLKWHHNFLRGIEEQLSGGYRLNLSTKQTSFLILCADHAGVDLKNYSKVREPHSPKSDLRTKRQVNLNFGECDNERPNSR